MILAIISAIKWWGTIAGIICIADIITYIKEKGFNKDSVLTQTLVAVFLVIMGGVIPFVDYLTRSILLADTSMLIAWFCISLAGWVNVLTYSQDNKNIMLAVAVLSLAVMLFASILMVI